MAVSSKNSLVDKVLSKEDAERFYKEEERNEWYRKQLEIILEYEKKVLASEEEKMYTQGNDGVGNSIAYRAALTKVARLLRNSNRGDSA